jgi:pantoate--beta-alanine ligase
MNVVRTIRDLKQLLVMARSTGMRVGFIPTMGALHGGHMSLIELSVQAKAFTVCSIFINPTQFNNKDDFEKYPVSIEEDTRLLEAHGCNLLFIPTVEEIYPEGMDATKWEPFDLGDFEGIWEGRKRPGHFQGVCQVVNRLLNAVMPDILFLGQKDYQQVKVIEKMVFENPTLKHIEIRVGKTIREPDGLAMSSRNRRLNEEQRQLASAIYRSFIFVQSLIDKGTQDCTLLNQAAAAVIMYGGFSRLDYITIVDLNDMKELKRIKSPMIMIIAAYLDDVRLIDNYIFQ